MTAESVKVRMEGSKQGGRGRTVFRIFAAASSFALVSRPKASQTSGHFPAGSSDPSQHSGSTEDRACVIARVSRKSFRRLGGRRDGAPQMPSPTRLEMTLPGTCPSFAQKKVLLGQADVPEATEHRS